ncbi:MAG: LysR family transcriptional regulator [Proteobacteria bacterium]|nr:LysR family transcriptional regulator [Pseudomonadota bacterium]
MFDWEDLHYFGVLAREGSLSAAARALRVDHATIARRVASLEADLHLKLVDRRPRSYELTAEGQRVAALTSRMEDAADAVLRLARAGQRDLAGEIALSAPPALLRAVIVPSLVALRHRHPGIVIDLIGEKRFASLSRREADIAVRLGRPEEPGLVARRVGTITFGLYAAPAYLTIVKPADFGFIAHDGEMTASPQQKWLGEIAGDRPIVLRTADADAQMAAAQAGIGIAALPDFLARGRTDLVAVKAAHPPLTRDIWLVVHEDLRRSPAIRAVLDHLAATFAARPAGKGPVKSPAKSSVRKPKQTGR